MDGDEHVQRLLKGGVGDVAFGEMVADGCEVVDIPDVVLESFGHAHHQVPVDNLAAGEESAHYVVCYFPGIYIADNHVVDLTVEEHFLFEDLLHRVHRRAQENEVAEPALVGLQRLFEKLQESLTVLEETDVLEFVQHHVDFAAGDGGDAPGEPEHGADVVFVYAPAERQHLVGPGVDVRVEHEMRVREAVAHYVCVLVRGGGDGADEGRAEAEKELFRAADLEHGQFCGSENFAGDAHVQEGLLQKRLLAGLGRLIDHHVLALVQEIGDNSLLAPAADVVFAGDRFVVNECRIHSVTTLFQTQK